MPPRLRDYRQDGEHDCDRPLGRAAPGSTGPAAQLRPGRTQHIAPIKQFPATPTAWHAARPGRSAPHSSPQPPGSSWSRIRRGYNTGSLRIPSRLAHQTRPIRQCWPVLTLSPLLPPAPAFLGSGGRQLRPSGEPDAQEWARPVRRAGSRNPPAARLAGRRWPTPTPSSADRSAVSTTTCK